MSSHNPMPIPGGWKKDTPRDTPRDTPAHERPNPAETIPRSATGLVSESGVIIDHEGRTIGKVAESEDARSLVGNTVTETGDVVNEAGDVLGRASLDDKEQEYTTGSQEENQEALEIPKAPEGEKSGATSGFLSSASSVFKQGFGFGRSKKGSESEAGQEASPDLPDNEKADTEAQAGKSEAAQSVTGNSQAARSEVDQSQVGQSEIGQSVADNSQAALSQVDQPEVGQSVAGNSQAALSQVDQSQVGQSVAGNSQAALSQVDQSEAGQPEADQPEALKSQSDLQELPPKPDMEELTDAGASPGSRQAGDVDFPAPENEGAPSQVPEGDEVRTEAGESLKDGQSQAPDIPRSQSGLAPSQAGAPSQAPDEDEVRTEAGESLKSGQSKAPSIPPSQGAGAPSEVPEGSLGEGEKSQRGSASEAPKIPSEIGDNISQIPDEDRTEAGESRIEGSQVEGSQDGPVALEDREQEDDQKTLGSKPDASTDQLAGTEAPETAIGEEQAQGESQTEETKEDEVKDEEAKEEEEGDKLDFTLLKGARVNKVGNLVDSKGDMVGRVVEGNVKQLLGKRSDEEGNIWNDAGKKVGKAEPITQAELEDQKHFAPFENFPDAIVESDGRVTYKGEQVGIVVEGDPKRLKGSKVDEDGDILDRNGNVVGKAEAKEKEEEVQEEPEKVDCSSLKNSTVNKVGNLVDSRGEVVGRVIEGDVKKLVGKSCDENGDIWDSGGKVVGKGEPLSSVDRSGQKEFAPFENFPDAIVEADGRVTFEGKQVGVVVQGDPKRLKGSKVDEDGDILDRNGNAVGKAEPWDEPEPEAEQVVDRSILAGKRVNKKGNCVDSSGTIYGRVIEGNLASLVGRMCDKEGNVRSESGDIIGKAELVSEGEREGSKDGPFAELSGLTISKDGKVVTPSGDVVGRLISGDPVVLCGRSVDEDGDVTDRNGNVLGKAERWSEPEVEKKKDPLAGRHVNREGNVVDDEGNVIGKLVTGDLNICSGKEVDDDGDVVNSKGHTIGHVSLLENIPPEPEPEHVETEEERKAREEEARQKEEEAKVKAEAEKDRKLAGQLGGCVEQSLDKIRPLCNLITSKIDSAERQPKEELDEEALVREVRPLIEEGGKILSEANGMIRGLDPDGRIQRQAKQKSGTREASPEEHHLAEQLKELTGTITQTIENAKRKIEGMPHAKKELNPLWGLLMEPLGQILAAVGLLLTGVLGLVGKLLSGLGLAPIVDHLLGALGLNKILGGLGLGSAYDALLGKDKKKK